MKIRILILLCSVLGLFAQGNQEAVITFKSISEMVTKGNPRNAAADVVEVLGYFTPNDGGGGMFTATNTAAGTDGGSRIATGIAGWSWQRIIGKEIAPEMFGVTASSSDNRVAMQAAIRAAEAFDVPLRFARPEEYVSGPVTLLSLKEIDLGGARFMAKANITGDLIAKLSGEEFTIKNGTLDGNKANQNAASSNWFSLVHVYHTNGTWMNEVRAERVNFTNFVFAGFRSTDSPGDYHLLWNKYQNGKEHGGVLGLQSSGINIRSYKQNTTGTVEIAFSEFSQDDLPSDFGTTDSSAPGGWIVSGGQTNNSANAWWKIKTHHNTYKKVGQDKAGNHIGGEDTYSGILSVESESESHDNALYIAGKFQNAGLVSIRDFKATSSLGDDGQDNDTPVLWLDPQERQDDEQQARYAHLDGIHIEGYENRPGLYITGVNAPGYELTIDRAIVTNSGSGIQISGWEGPITLNNPRLYVNSGAALQISDFDGVASINAPYVVATNATGITLGGTNGVYFLDKIYAEADGVGWTAFTARGVKALTVSSGRFNGKNGATAASLLDDANTNHNGTVFWNFGAIHYDNGSLSYTATSVNRWTGIVHLNSSPENLIAAHAPALALRTDSGNTRPYIKTGTTNSTTWREVPVNQVTGTSTSYAVQDGDLFIRVDSSGGALTITNQASPFVGHEVEIFKNSSDGNIITISGNGKTMNGSSTLTLTNQYDGFHLRYNGIEWRIISQGNQWQTKIDFIVNPSGFSLGDITTEIAAGNNKNYWVPLYDGTIVGVIGSLFTASSSGVVTYDIHLNGTSIMTTSKIVIDANETSTVTAATPPVLTTVNFSAGDRLTFDIDTDGTGATGPQLGIYWKRR